MSVSNGQAGFQDTLSAGRLTHDRSLLGVPRRSPEKPEYGDVESSSMNSARLVPAISAAFDCEISPFEYHSNAAATRISFTNSEGDSRRAEGSFRDVGGYGGHELAPGKGRSADCPSAASAYLGRCRAASYGLHGPVSGWAGAPIGARELTVTKR